MKITGIIAECNPFHEGHRYLISKSKEITGADYTVVLLSGDFVQRGAPAVEPKEKRTRAILESGADAVLELPVLYSTAGAEIFAEGAVQIFHRLGCITDLCFGSESGDTDALINAADKLSDEPEEVSQKIKSFISEGMNYPSARSRAYEGIIDGGILSAPNNILAAEYICAAKRLNSTINFRAIKRYAVGHDEAEVTADTASASAIRARLFKGADISSFVPPGAREITNPYDLSRLDSAILYTLRNYSTEKLALINDVSEGLENRIKKLSFESSSFDELCEKIKTKRYTRSRINRIVLSAYLNLTKELCAVNPPYVRILGMNGTGIKILGNIKHSCPLPIITKTADYTADDPVFLADLRAGEAFSLCAPEAGLRLGGADFKNSPIVL